MVSRDTCALPLALDRRNPHKELKIPLGSQAGRVERLNFISQEEISHSSGNLADHSWKAD